LITSFAPETQGRSVANIQRFFEKGKIVTEKAHDEPLHPTKLEDRQQTSTVTRQHLSDGDEHSKILTDCV